jgi:phage tail-like protein
MSPSARLGHPGGTPVGLATMLPGLLADDDFTSAFAGALDEVLAPIHRTLDSFWAYLDPALAPLDFSLWLATWLNAEPDESWPEERIRQAVVQAWSGFVHRGTAAGLVDELSRLAEGEWTVSDSGGVARSQTPGEDLPGTSDAMVTIDFAPADPSIFDRERLERLIGARLPAHVRLTFSVVG